MSNSSRNSDIKFKYQDQTRRIRLSEEEFQAISFSSLSSLACSLFPALVAIEDPTNDIVLKWVDEENDVVSLSSSAELFVAMQSMQSGDRIARFDISLAETKNKEQAAPAATMSASSSSTSSDSPTPSTSTSSSDKQLVHSRVTCDQCKTNPIVGLRFKCTERYDYDLCEACEKSAPQPFPMFKIYHPDQSDNFVFASLDLSQPESSRQVIKSLHHKLASRRSCYRGRHTERVDSESTERPPVSQLRSPSSILKDFDAPSIHTHISCNECNVGPIVGIRYKCTLRVDFDLCEACEKKSAQPHPMIKIYHSNQMENNDSIFVAMDLSDPRDSMETYRRLRNKFRRACETYTVSDQTYDFKTEEANQIHIGITCNDCGMTPIKGARFRCVQRRNFNLCENCEKKAIQPFAMTKIYVPQQSADTGGKGEFSFRNSRPGPYSYTSPHRGPSHHSLFHQSPFHQNYSHQGPIQGPHHQNPYHHGPSHHGRPHIRFGGNPFSHIERGLGGSGQHMEEDRTASGINWAPAFPVNGLKMESGQNSFPRRPSNNTVFKLFARNYGDITFPSGTVVAPLTRFVKTWRICNDGEAQWPAGCVLVLDEESNSDVDNTDNADLCARDIKIELPQPQVGEFIEVSIPLVAPELPGNYVSHFKFETADGIQFGHRVWVDIIVETEGNDSRFLKNLDSLHISESIPDISSSGDESDKHICDKDGASDNSILVIDASLATASCEKPINGNKSSTISFAAFRPVNAVVRPWEWEIMQLTDMGLYRDDSVLIPILVKHLKSPAGTEEQKNCERLAPVINELIDSL